LQCGKEVIPGKKGSESLYPVQEIGEKIKKIKLGDRSTREDFLEGLKPFVHKMACKFSGRILEWGKDEELAIALIALNEAIDRFREEVGVPFLAFARIVILSRLTDYQRHENRAMSVQVPLLNSIDESDALEYDQAWEAYLSDMTARDREEEIKEFEKLINEYKVSFRDLVKCSPRHRDTRQSLMKVALELTKSDRLIKELTDNKKLPLAELEKLSGISRKTMERGRKYIIAIALLICKRSEFLYLSSYIQLPVQD
jgi:RNA polymerase sigma factor